MIGAGMARRLWWAAVIELGVAARIEAQSEGEPGRRVFRLRILGEGGQSAALKVEKEHLLGLLVTLRELLEKAGYQGGPAAPSSAGFPDVPHYDFPVGGLGVGFSEPEKAVVLEARKLETEGQQEAVSLRVRFRQEQGAALVDQLNEILSSGRPICRLCALPMDATGHVCIRSNGQSREPIPEDPDDSEA